MLFADLPEDIIHHIFLTHFSGDGHSLARIATLSKRLNRIATPILYSHVTLDLDRADESRKVVLILRLMDLFWPLTPTKVRRFIMSVFSSPYLAHCVRSLELNSLYWVSHQSLSRRRKELVARMMAGNILGRPDRLDMFKLITVVRRLPLVDTHKHHWCSELQEVDPSLDALIALVFVFLPELSRLESNWSSDPTFIWHMLPQTDRKVDSSPSPLILRNLAQLKVNSESPCGNSSEILPFFQMPALTHFFGSHWGPIRREGWDSGVEDQAGDLESNGTTLESPIIHLELRHCSIDLYTLQTFIKWCRSVRTFILHRDWDPRVHVRLPAGFILRALRPLRETLENIALSFEPGIYVHHEGEIHPLDFSQFSVLANLNVAVGYIIHDPEDFDPFEFSTPYDSGSEQERFISNPLHNRLPESLEVLRITGYSTPKQMQFLMDDCCRLLHRRSQFPRLRELSIEAPFDDPDFVFDTKPLQLKALDADVQLRKVDITGRYPNDADDILTPAGRDWGMDGEFKWGTKLF